MTATTANPDALAARRRARWHESLAYGEAGIALWHVEAAHAGTEDWDTAHRSVLAMTRAPISARPIDACLYRGAPAVAFVLRAANRPSYAAALERLDQQVASVTRQRLQQARERMDRGLLPALREFDIMCGLTGLGAYLLASKRHDELMREVLGYLVRLTEPVSVQGHMLPGWWTNHSPADQHDTGWRGGHGNLGIAHGIAGPLALMSFATLAGVEVPGQTDAIGRVVGWYERWRCGPQRQTWWPGVISRPELQANAVNQPGPQQPSWCYGTPGIARALQVASIALADPPAQRRAEDALAACVEDAAQLGKLVDGSLCHGWAGLLEATRHTARDAGSDSRLTALLPHLHRRGLRYIDGEGGLVGEGLLDGRAGINLALLSTDIAADRETRWASCLLLHG